MIDLTFYIAAAVAVFSTLMVITRLNAVHALLYLIVSLLAVALVFFFLGAPFAAALEIIIYAGAIMILFVFVIMMLNLGPTAIEKERFLLQPGIWRGPALLAVILLVELFYVLGGHGNGSIGNPVGNTEVSSLTVGLTLFGPYMLGVELASMLLLAGMIGAFHLARQGTRMEKDGVSADRSKGI